METNWAAVGLAFSGTLVIYNIDRLRDVEADQKLSPDRSRFFTAYRIPLLALTLAAAAGALYIAAQIEWIASAMLIPVFGIGICHRYLKHLKAAKLLYIAASWVCVVVGLPAILSTETKLLPWVIAIMAATMAANVIAFNIRDAKTDAGQMARVGPPRVLSYARICAALGVAVSVFAPFPADRLVAIPALTLLALLVYRPTERFVPVAMDGALLAGALITLLRFL